MKHKILLTLILLMNIICPAFAISNEIKAGGVFLIKMSIGVVAASIVIGLGLWLYSIIKIKRDSIKTDSRADKFTCEIDDAKTIGDAIKTFLVINK